MVFDLWMGECFKRIFYFLIVTRNTSIKPDIQHLYTGRESEREREREIPSTVSFSSFLQSCWNNQKEFRFNWHSGLIRSLSTSDCMPDVIEGGGQLLSLHVQNLQRFWRHCYRLLMLVSLLSREHGAQGTQSPIQGAFLYVSMCLYVGHDFKTLP